jgi:thiazole/oxazole-forming peptide maturase SagC family component
MSMGLNRTQKVKAVPAQLIDVDGGVIIRRGCVATKIAGAGVAETVEYLLATAAKGITCGEFIQMFPVATQPSVERLIQHLLDRRLLVPFQGGEPDCEPETPLDVFYWHFNRTVRDVNEQLNARKFVLIGDNEISWYIVSSLERTGVHNITIVNDPELRNGRLSSRKRPSYHHNNVVASVEYSLSAASALDSLDETTVHCVIATSDSGVLSGIRTWNSYCVDRRLNFMPVTLQAHVAYIGPLVIPGETACFACLELRQRSVKDKDPDQVIIEDACLNGQDVVGFHPSMISVAAEFATIELMKAYGPLVVFRRVGMLLEVDLLAGAVHARRVLKIPRCPVCTPLKTQPSINIRKNPVAERE